jgi:GNAT superfamily N-acetyltransferase
MPRIFQRLLRVWHEGGPLAVIRLPFDALAWRAREQWNLRSGVMTIVERDLDGPIDVTPLRKPMEVRTLRPADLASIRENLYPHLVGAQAFDRRIFEELEEGKPRPEHIVVALLDGRVVHYQIFIQAKRYAGIRLAPDEAYWVATFTHPDARGMNLMQHSLAVTMNQMREMGVRRAVGMIHRDNVGSWKATSRVGIKPRERGRARG